LPDQVVMTAVKLSLGQKSPDTCDKRSADAVAHANYELVYCKDRYVFRAV